MRLYNLIKNLSLGLLWIILTFLSACKDSQTRKAEKFAERLKVPVIRLEVLLFESELDGKKLLDTVKKTIPYAYKDYFEGVVRLGNPDDEMFTLELTGLRNDFFMKSLYAEVKKIYGTDEVFFQSLQKGLGRYKFYFSKRPVPTIVTCISALNYATAVNDSTLFIGLDMYLGQDYEAYLAMNMPKYIRKRRRAEYLIADALKAWLLTEFPTPVETPSFAENLIHYGRIMWVLERLLPNEKKYILMGYTKEEIEYCEKNKRNIWQFFIDANILQSKEYKDFSKYFEEAPFSYGMPKQTPGRTGIWLGWHIVEEFMRKHNYITPDSLMRITDLNKVFIQSGINP